MNKNGVMFGVLGLIIGLVIGFMGANSLNRPAAGQVSTTTTNPTTASGTNPGLPADHPPIGATTGSSGDQPSGGALPEVMQAIEKAKQQPNDYNAQMTAADLYYQIQRFDEAAKFYEAANKLKPGEVEAIIKAGNSYFDSEKYEQAEKWYLQALQKTPNDVSVRTDLGLTFFLRDPRDIDRAIKEYKTSLTLKPDHAVTLQNLALAYKEKGDTPDYDQTLAKLKAVDPENPLFAKGSQ